MPSQQCRKSHGGDKTILWPSSQWDSQTGKMTPPYRIRAQVISEKQSIWLFNESALHTLHTKNCHGAYWATSIRTACCCFISSGATSDCKVVIPLQWHHNEHDSISDNRHLDCLLSRLFRRRSNKTSKLQFTGLFGWNPSWTGRFPSQRAGDAENVSIWWCHHGGPWRHEMAEYGILWNVIVSIFNNIDITQFHCCVITILHAHNVWCDHPVVHMFLYACMHICIHICV